MDGSGSNLTIDFSDASFDNSSENEQPVPGVDNIDVVFPIDDNPEITVGSGASEKTGHDYSDNRGDVNTAAQAVALMPSGSAASMMDEFVFEFDNDENDDGNVTSTDQGLKITSKAAGPSEDILELNLEGSFANLHDGGTLDLYVNEGTTESPQFVSMTLGMSDSSEGTSGSVVGGDMNGGDMGGGNDTAVINVDATTAIQGTYTGGSGYDELQLVEGVRSDNGAIVDFVSGSLGGNSAYIVPASDDGSEVYFQIAEWESLQLTDNADSVYIGHNTGAGLTDIYDTAYWNPGASNSMLKLQTGYTDGEASDVVSVNADSDLYMSFEFANDSDVGIEATFRKSGNVDIESIGGDEESPVIDVDVDQAGGTGMVIDYLEATSNKDVIENNGDIGVMVDLGGSTGDADIFRGSDDSENDVLDARMVSDLDFSESGSYIKVTTDDNSVNAKLRDVDYIMVTDIGSDVDFYEDMSHLNDTQLIDKLGAGATDAYGVGYDVITSAQVDRFGDNDDLRVYYEGDHDDFIDTNDDMTYSDGLFTMSSGDSSRGSTWESEIVSQYGSGQEPGFYVEISGKKVAVTFDDEKGSWKVDSSALKVAEDAGSNIDMSSIADNEKFASDVMDRFGLKPAAPEQSTSEGSEGTSGGGFPTVSITATNINVTIGHNGTKWVLDGNSDGFVGYKEYDMLTYDSIDDALNTLFMDVGKIAGLAKVTSSDAGNTFDNVDLETISSGDWNTYLSDNSGGGGGGSSPTEADAQNKVDDIVASVENDDNDGAGFAKLVDDLATMMHDGAISVLSGYGGYGLIQSPGEVASDISQMDVSVLNSMLKAMSPAQQDEIYNLLTSNDAVKDMAGIVAGTGIDVQTNATELGMFSMMTSEKQKAVMTFSDVTDISSVMSNIYSVYDGVTGSNYSLSNDIYLNATEEMIAELLKPSGKVTQEAFNFDYYTKMDLVTDTGVVTVNVKLQEDGPDEGGSPQFSINADDIDVAVESFYNVADDDGAAVTSSGAAGEFVKIDDAGDIALGNGGDDTYVVGDDGGDIYGGIALEYGDINQYGGLKGTVDAVNFNSVDSVSELTFRRDELRNEEDGSSLFIGDSGGNETVLFDNYNEYLDFRRVEFLTVEDGANNDEIYEIVTNEEDNIDDWDNEIYVANGGSMDVELGGTDYVFGSVDKDGNAINNDTFNVSLSDMMSAGSGTINLSNVTSDDTINVTDAATWMGVDDQNQLNAKLALGLTNGGGEIEFSVSGTDLSIKVDSLSIDDTYSLVYQSEFDG